jgi:hypothetical protein
VTPHPDATNIIIAVTASDMRHNRRHFSPCALIANYTSIATSALLLALCSAMSARLTATFADTSVVFSAITRLRLLPALPANARKVLGAVLLADAQASFAPKIPVVFTTILVAYGQPSASRLFGVRRQSGPVAAPAQAFMDEIIRSHIKPSFC